MSPLVTWLVLALLSATSAQNATSDQTPVRAQNPIDQTPHNETIETETSAPGHEHGPHLHSPNEHRDEMPHLKFNPPDFIPFPKVGQVAQFWRDHPDFKAIPDLPARDTEYPKWLLKVMGRIHPTTPASNPTENDQVLSPGNRQQPEVRPLDRRISWPESGHSEILQRRNDMERRSESNNLPVERDNGNRDVILPPESPNQESFLNSRMQHLRPVPNNIQRSTFGRIIPNFSQNQNRPILFRVPLNTQRNPNNFVIRRDNRFERRPPFSTGPVEMVPLQRRHFRGIPVTVSRPSMVHQPGILMLPVRNRNVPSRFSPPNFFQSHPQRMSTARERFMFGPNQNRRRNPTFARQNEILVDPQFSRESWSEVPVRDENSQRIPTLTNRRQDFVRPEKQANTFPNRMIQQNESASIPRRSGIGARNKRQSGFEPFDPFGMGNIFSFFPPEKEPRNSFNWFPQESMMNSPTQRSPVNSGAFNPNANRRPVKTPPKQQINYPQDSWMGLPPSSSNTVPTFQVQNPKPNRGPSNKQIPDDFMIIQPNKASTQRGGSNKLPWMLSNMFGADLFPDNNGNQMWTFQRPFDDQPETNNNQPPRTNREQFPNNVPTRPPPVNRNNNNQDHVQPQENWRQTPQRPAQPQQPTVSQPQQNWRPAPQRPVPPQLPPTAHGTWIPRESTHKKAPVSRMNHFHEVPAPHHHHRPHHHHPEKQSPRPTEVPANHHGDGHQPHRRPIQPEIRKGKRKLNPSEVRHLLSLLPEFPKDIHKPRHGNSKSQTVGLTINASGNKQKRAALDPILESADDGNLTRNYPGSKPPVNSRNPQSPKIRRKRDVEESVMQDVVFGSYGYHSGYDYQDGSYSDYSGPFYGNTDGNNHESGSGDLWGNMFPKSHNSFNGVWDWPNHGYHGPHQGFGHFEHPHGHTAGYYLPHPHPHPRPHPHPHPHHSNYWHGNVRPMDRLPGGIRVVAIPPAVPRGNPNQLSYTARFRYRFGIYPGYSDYIPSTDDHEIFFFYDAKHEDRKPDALIPLRSY